MRLEDINVRHCNECGKEMWDGFCIESGMEYYCSEECLHKNISEEEYNELYDDGNGDSYWTDWYDEYEEYKRLMENKKEHKVNVIYDIDNLKITITSEHYKREITCLTLDSYLEEIRRMYESLKDYSKEKGVK